MTFDLVEMNFKNLVSFYCEELRKIEQGERATDILSQYVRGRLRDAGAPRARNDATSITHACDSATSELAILEKSY